MAIIGGIPHFQTYPLVVTSFSGATATAVASAVLAFAAGVESLVLLLGEKTLCVAFPGVNSPLQSQHFFNFLWAKTSVYIYIYFNFLWVKTSIYIYIETTTYNCLIFL